MSNSQHYCGSWSSNYFQLTACGILFILMPFPGEFEKMPLVGLIWLFLLNRIQNWSLAQNNLHCLLFIFLTLSKLNLLVIWSVLFCRNLFLAEVTFHLSLWDSWPLHTSYLPQGARIADNHFSIRVHYLKMLRKERRCISINLHLSCLRQWSIGKLSVLEASVLSAQGETTAHIWFSFPLLSS